MDKILILDFGSQYTMLIARRIRECCVYCEIHPFNNIPQIDSSVKGVILSGSPSSVNDENAPVANLDGIKGRLPLLGICYGAQRLVRDGGGVVAPEEMREYGRATINVIDGQDPLLAGVRSGSTVWMSHGDTMVSLPKGFRVTASSDDIPNIAYKIDGEPTWGIQFHPEVHHSEDGARIISNFVCGICGCKADWTPENFITDAVRDIRSKVGEDEVILGLSGGVDSSVVALLLKKAIGDRLQCIFVNSGLLRKGEYEKVLASYEGMGLNVTGVDASAKFIDDLKGVDDPEKKRRIIGRDYIEAFNDAASRIGGVKWLAQGTIYPDVIESSAAKGPSRTIKTHHNVGGLPEDLNFKIVEPLRLLFKDEVRRVGKAIGLDPAILGRHPFPGPGLAIRVLGEVTPEKLRILRDADDIFISLLHERGLYDSVWQAGAVLLPVRSVGVMGDDRTYENCVALRAVASVDGMTADWVRLPYDFLAEVSSEIIGRVRGVNRVVYDISSKPPATIEWE